MITGVQHFSFTVSNIEETLKFFRDTLGLKATPVRESGGPIIEKMLKMPSVRILVANVTTPDNLSIELIEYKTPKGMKLDLKTCNIGVAHIAFKVDNIQKMYEDLSAKNVQFNHAPVWLVEGPLRGYALCYLKGPDGVTLEFMEPPKNVKMDPATGFVL